MKIEVEVKQVNENSFVIVNNDDEMVAVAHKIEVTNEQSYQDERFEMSDNYIQFQQNQIYREGYETYIAVEEIRNLMNDGKVLLSTTNGDIISFKFDNFIIEVPLVIELDEDNKLIVLNYNGTYTNAQIFNGLMENIMLNS